MRIQASARDFGRLSAIEDLPQNIQELPTYYYDYRRFCLPLTAAELSSEFGANIKLFDVNETTDGSRQTNAETGTSVNEPFIACAAGIMAFGEGEAFSTYGVHGEASLVVDGSLPSLATVTPVEAGCYCGAVNVLTTNAPTAQATFWWGAPTWRFIEKFFQAYRLEIKINRRFQIVDESLLDIGMTPTPPKFIGASDSTIQPMPFIRAVNDTLTAKGITTRFFPPNNIVGVIPDNDVEDANLVTNPIGPPLVGVTYGHPWIAGLSNRVFCFNSPILFIPGMRFDITFQNIENSSIYEALESTVTLACQTPMAEATGAITGEALGDNAGAHCVVPGGCVSLGAVFKGAGLQPSACVEYMLNYFGIGSVQHQMYTEVANNVGILLKNPELRSKRPELVNKLAGWLKGTGE